MYTKYCNFRVNNLYWTSMCYSLKICVNLINHEYVLVSFFIMKHLSVLSFQLSPLCLILIYPCLLWPTANPCLPLQLHMSAFSNPKSGLCGCSPDFKHPVIIQNFLQLFFWGGTAVFSMLSLCRATLLCITFCCFSSDIASWNATSVSWVALHLSPGEVNIC